MRLFVLLVLTSSVVAGRYGSYGRGTSHSYPHHTTGLSGSGSHTAHSYPATNGLSGSHSGNVRHSTYQQHNTVQNNYSPKTEIHHHYHYSPPQQITYGSTYHPVYQGHPPVYVYEYRDSGSRFDTLLTGLALYNLGRSSSHHNYNPDRDYSGYPGEICKLGISKRTGDYEETRIECRLMSSFIMESVTPRITQTEQHVITKNKTEITQVSNGNGTNNSSVTTIVKSETVVDALKAKGPSIAVTPGMTCYMIRIYRDSTTTRKSVDCGLLQEYARSSMYRNCSEYFQPLMVVLLGILAHLFI